MPRTLILVCGAIALSSCQTAEQANAVNNANLSARLERYNGASVREFIEETGMTPVDYYRVSEGRVFVFKTAPIYVTLPATHVTPAITRSNQCTLLVRAVRTRAGDVADAWAIKGTQRDGACGDLPIPHRN